MALPASIHRVIVALSDVDRGVYETLDLRLARHPSETIRYMLVRLLAYCLSYEEGIAFSRSGLSNPDEPPLAVHDPTGLLMAWIEVGMPSADRLHKASKAARKVALYTAGDLALLRKEAASRPIHKLADIAVWPLASALLDELEPHVGRETKLELVRSDGVLYLTVAGRTLESRIEATTLAPAD
ncbi:MAG: YaeQ family protein [Myxococcota bacterium]